MNNKVYGIVVIGVGIAGRVRVRDILQYTTHNDIQWCLKGFVSRRSLEIEGTEQLTEDEVFTRADIDAILVCTENELHEPLVRRGLECGKHVLCEYPVALSSNVAKEFFDLAERKGVILHGENIGLINDYKERLQSCNTPWTHCEILLKGGYNGWTENSKSGIPFVRSVSLVETARHLCGDVTAVGGALSETESSFEAVARLRTSDKRTVTITVNRSKDFKGREKSICFRLQDGSDFNLRPSKSPGAKPGTQSTPSKTPGSKPGMFMKDFYMFMEEVDSGQIDEEMKTRTIRGLQIAEDVHRLTEPKL